MFEPGGHFVANDEPVRNLITTAYQLRAGQMAADPALNTVLSKSFDVETEAKGNPSIAEMRMMLRSLLRERFNMRAHWETRELPLYALELVKSGKTGDDMVRNRDITNCIDPTRGMPSAMPAPGAMPPSYCGMFSISRKPEGLIGTGIKIPMDKLVAWLGGYLDRPLLDETGLMGDFDVNLEFASQQPPDASHPLPDPAVRRPDSSAFPPIAIALREQLGLKLDAKNGPVQIFVIDHIEEPTPN